jgi:phosphoglycerol transferase MdoB-like AlkP superfamily enzyme
MKGRLRGYFEGLQIRGNVYVALVYRLSLVMLLFSACRVGFYLFNLKSFSDITSSYLLQLMKGGLVFDLAAILYINSLYLVLVIIPLNLRFNKYYQLGLKILFIVTNGLALTSNVADFIYFKFTLRRTTADVFRQFENEINLSGLLFSFMLDYWYAVVVLILFLVLLITLYSAVKVTGPQLKNTAAYYISGGVVMFTTITLFIGGVRGGYKSSTRPITLSNAGEYVKDSRDISIVLNTPFAILRTLGKTKVQKVNYFSAAEAESIYNPIHIPADSTPFKKMNVVVIILESFSKEFFGSLNSHKNYGKYKGYTPFLDSLIRYSLTFEYSIANGRKSIDGLPSVISSIPSLGVPYFLSPYSGNKINSLASLLGDKGYHTSFFHGAPNGSMGFKAFMNVAGVQHYFGKNEYNNDDDFDGMWGIWDEQFLGFYADKMNEFPEPFMTSFFSVSSHHPFKIPEKYDEKFKGGPLVIQKCVEYTDYSLKLFFQKVSKMPWYKNTLFVITADHTSSEIEFAEGRTDWGYYSVPIIFFKPNKGLVGRSKELIQQIDIMPSVLGYLHYDKPYFAFGRDIMREKSVPFAFNYHNNGYQLFQDEYFFRFDGTKPISLYDFRMDRLLQRNLLTERADVSAKMERKIKAIIQQYNNRMIENKLTVPQ